MHLCVEMLKSSGGEIDQELPFFMECVVNDSFAEWFIHCYGRTPLQPKDLEFHKPLCQAVEDRQEECGLPGGMRHWLEFKQQIIFVNGNTALVAHMSFELLHWASSFGQAENCSD